MEVVGTAVGVVSLGLQLCKGVTDYLEGLKCARYEIASVARQLECLEIALEVVQTGLQKIGSVDASAERAVRRCVGCVNDEMEELSTFLDEIKQPDPGDGLRSWAREQKKKASYPFSRSNLQKLEARLTAVNTVLSTAIQAMDLHVEAQKSLNLARSLAGIESQLTEIARAIGDTQGQTAMSSESCAVRLVSKPSALAAAAQHVGVDSSDAKSVAIRSEPTLRCTCRPTTLRTPAWKSSFGWFSWFSEEIVSRKHGASCPFSEFDTPAVLRRLGLEFQKQACRKHITTAVSISVRMVSEGGGWSIGPELRHENKVDMSKSPLVRLFRIPNGSFSLFAGAWRVEWDDNTQRYFMRNVEELFRRNIISPGDIDFKNGQSFMHCIAKDLSISPAYIPGVSPTMRDLASTLSRAGVGRWSPDNDGRSPLDLLMQRFWFPTATEQAFAAFLQGDDDMNLERFEQILRVIVWRDAGEWVQSGSIIGYPMKSLERRTSVLVADGTDPITDAVLERSIAKVEKALQAEPPILTRRRTPSSILITLYLALMRFPPALPALFDACSDCLNASSDGSTVDHSVALLVNSAICLTEHDCTGPWAPTHRCASCDGETRLHALLKAGVPIHWGHPLGSGERLARGSALAHAPERIVRLFIKHLARRRCRLNNLAMALLPKNESARLGLYYDKVLDAEAGAVVDSLSSHGYQVPLGLTIGWRGLPPRKSSVYRYTSSVRLAEQLAEAGFRSINTAAGLSCHFPIRMGRDIYRETEWFSYNAWLLARGAADSLGTPFRPDRSLFPVRLQRHDSFWSRHSVAFRLATILAGAIGTFPKRMALPDTGITAATQLWAVKEHDSCLCGCSGPGCSPLTAFITRMIGEVDIYFGNKRENIFEMATDFDGGLGQVLCGSPSTNLLQCVRAWTFRLLGCRHTCCMQFFQMEPEEFEDFDDSDRREIRQEDRHHLDLLDDLMGEFEAEHSRHEGSFQEFLVDYWQPRMRNVLEELDAVVLTKSDVEAMEEVGVVMGPARAPNDVLNSPDDSTSDVWSPEPDECEGVRKFREARNQEALRRAMDRICGWSLQAEGYDFT